MIDPLSAVGLASSIVQFVDFSVKVSRRLSEYTEAGLDDVPKSLQTVATQLPLLLNALERIKSNVQDDKLDFDTRCILKGVVAGCTSQVQRVERILDGVTNQTGDSLSVKARKAFKSLQAEDKLAAVEKNLQTYISVLILHHVVDEKAAPIPDQPEVSVFDPPVQPVTGYKHRQDLMDCVDACFWKVKKSQTDHPVSVYLTGVKGTGKTQLALAYCNQVFASGHFKTIFWLDASSPQALSISLQNAAHSIRKSRQGSPLEKIKFLKRYLSERWHPWLLVLHGYESDAFDYDEIFRLLPDGGADGAAVGYLFTISSGEPPLRNGTIIKVPQYHNPDQQKSLNTGLMVAIAYEETDKALSLIEQGADKDSDEKGRDYHCSAIDRAALKGMTEVVKKLLELGANPRIRASPGGGSEITAFEWGADHPEILKMLLDHEDANNAVWEPPFYDATLEEAAAKGAEESVGMLLDRRPVDLDKALWAAANGGRTALVRMLLVKKAEKARDEDKIKSGCLFPIRVSKHWEGLIETPLVNAVRAAQFETAKSIIAICSGLGFPASADSLDSALKVTADQRPRMQDSAALLDMMAFLLDAGANPDSGNIHSPLRLFSCSGVTKAVSLLLDRGADPWLQDHKGKTAIENAAEYNYIEVTSLLLKAMSPKETAGESGTDSIGAQTLSQIRHPLKTHKGAG